MFGKIVEISLPVLLIICGLGLLAVALNIGFICIYCRKKRRKKRSARSNAILKLDKSNSVQSLNILFELNVNKWDNDVILSKIDALREKVKSFQIQIGRTMLALNRKKYPDRVDVDDDFHGVTAQEAKLMLPVLLTEKFELNREQEYIIDIGNGIHSQDGRGGVFKHIVPQVVRENGYQYQNIDDGVFRIYK